MNTHKHDHSIPSFPDVRGMAGVFYKRALVFSLALVTLCGGRSESWATLTPPAALSQYAFLSNGSLNINHSTFNGNVGVKSGSMSGSNNDTFNKNFSYQIGPLDLNHSTVAGIEAQDVTLKTTIDSIAQFSYSLSQLAPTVTLNDNFSGNTILNGNGATNVVDFSGSSYNRNGTITLNGSANDVFYLNVFTSLDLSGIILGSEVKASNVFLNVVSGHNAKLSGTINATVLAFDPTTKQATSLEITGATLNGDVVAGSMNINHSTFNGVSTEQLAIAVAPETSSATAMVLFAGFLLASSSTRFWKNKLQSRLA